MCRRWTENFLGFVKGPDQCWAGAEHVLQFVFPFMKWTILIFLQGGTHGPVRQRVQKGTMLEEKRLASFLFFL